MFSTSSLLLWALTSLPALINAKPQLHLNGLKFKLAVFSDLHFGENEESFGIAQDVNSTQLMQYVLDLEKPDFAVLNGDLITGENTFAKNSSKYVDKIVKPLVDREIPWASTYGNHDTSPTLSRQSILKEEQKYDLALTQGGPPDKTDGISNYQLEIYPDPTWFNDGKPVGLLHFFDSRGTIGTKEENPNWVSARTASWFRSSSAASRQEYGELPSLAFAHIPMRAFVDLQSSHKANVSGPHYPGLNADKPLAQQGNGTESEPFMQALLDTPGLHSVYSGHDHGDSWCGRWPNSTLPGDTASRPFLCFCKHSGFGGYGEWNRGVRIVELDLDFYRPGHIEVKTWVRMQQGTIVTAVQLNETYGQNKYPTADGGYHPY